MNRTMKQHMFYALNISISLVIGLIVYVCCRPDTYVSQAVYNLLGIFPDIGGFVNWLPTWLLLFIRNYLADIIWAYALTFTVCYILWNQNKSMFPIFGIVAVFEICIEVSQKVGIMSGTFDWFDIFLEICISALVMLVIKTKYKEKQK